ncbi:MAG: hypothetical protein LAO79_20025, partial [Acidobacteriia bacterium]|nr:hypothetical protein [Terriglobia bacterium]
MRSASRRLVLGFFPPGTGHPESVLRGFSPADRRIKSRYGPLLLPEERLAGARVARENVQEAARRLRDAGSPSVFVLYEAEPPQPAGELRGDARQQLLTRLDRGERNFHDACAGLEDALRLHHTLAAAAEWLLDNSYLVVTNAAEIRRNLPKHHSAAEARLYDIARALVERTDGAITPENLAECLREDHEPSGLTMADLWLFPLVLRVALIERLSDIARETGWSQQLHETASLWADRLAAAARAGTVDAMLTHLDAEPAAPFPHFGIELLEQLQDEESALAPAQRWMERRFGGSLAPLVQQEHTHEAARRVSTVNAFGSLRILGRLEFAEIFEQVSRVEADLRKDPGGIYPRSDFDTRDQCRHVVEQIARHSPSSEPEVARAAVRLAWRSGGHVAQFLLSSSIAELEKETATRVPVRTKLVRAVRRHATLLYFSLIFALTACFAVVVIALAHEAGARNIAALAIYGILALFPLSELAMQIVNALVISMLPPAKLPKMSFRDGIPEDQATLVVVPMMLTNPDAVRHELEKLEIRLLANPESNLWFGLLADFTDCAHASDPADEALLEAVRQGIVDLNRRYPGERFVLFHRQRVWS